MNKQATPRIESLDWLRGMMAISIMLFHLYSWIYSPMDSSSILGKLGIYGITIFFILSGLSIAIVYNEYLVTFKSAIFFIIRRIFRIWPLLWLACFLIAIPHIIKTGTYDWQILLLNISTLFGFIDPSNYMAIGAWSIGNEMVYYTLTPLIILIFNYSRVLGNAILLFTFSIGILFAFHLLDSNVNLDLQWAIYVNPFNNLFLYIAGIGIYYSLRNVEIPSKINISLLILVLFLFFILPFHGDQIVLVTGIGRIVFSLLSLLIVIGFYKLKFNVGKSIGILLENLGLATYGIYLIHPFIYTYTSYLLKEINIFNVELLFILVVIITIFLSIFLFKFFESFFINLGKKLTSDLNNNKLNISQNEISKND